MKIRAVAFDIDGTLYSDTVMAWRSLPWVLRNLRLLGALQQVRKDLRNQPVAGSFHQVQAEALAKKLNIPPHRAFALVEGKIYTRWYRNFKKIQPFPYLREALDAFRAAGLPLALMSDFPIRHRVEDLGLPGPWQASFSSEETGFLKPHPQAFTEISRRLDIPSSEILYVGNSYKYDVLGALEAGMPSAHITKNPPKNSKAVFSFQNYRQLKDFVLKNL